MTSPQDVVSLFDVDNTLLDNDQVIVDLHAHLEIEDGAASTACCWAVLEGLRSELGDADDLGALQRCLFHYRPDWGLSSRHVRSPRQNGPGNGCFPRRPLESHCVRRFSMSESLTPDTLHRA